MQRRKGNHNINSGNSSAQGRKSNPTLHNSSQRLPTSHLGTQPSQTPKVYWPSPLRSYIARSFEGCAKAERAEIDRELRSIITEAVKAEVHWSLNWDSMPLPYVILMQRKAKEKPVKEEEDDAIVTELDGTATGGYM